MFSKNLKRLRERRGVSQTDVATAIGNGSTQQKISAWETGSIEPDIRSLCLLADYFGVSIDYLVGHTTPQPEDSTTQMKRLLNSLTSEQVSLLCAIAMKSLENGIIHNE